MTVCSYYFEHRDDLLTCIHSNCVCSCHSIDAKDFSAGMGNAAGAGAGAKGHHVSEKSNQICLTVGPEGTNGCPMIINWLKVVKLWTLGALDSSPFSWSTFSLLAWHLKRLFSSWLSYSYISILRSLT